MSSAHGRPRFAGVLLCLSCAFVVSVDPTSARDSTALKANGPSTAQDIAGLDQSVIDDLVSANRILADQGVLDAFGHISVRDPRDAHHYLMSHWVAPALVTEDDISVYDLDNTPVDKNSASHRLYSERYIHGEIYKARPDVMAIVHTHSPYCSGVRVSDVPFKPILLNAAFLGVTVPVFEIRKQFGTDTNMLIDSPERGRALTKTLGDHSVVSCADTATLLLAQIFSRGLECLLYGGERPCTAAGDFTWGHVIYLSPGEIKILAEGYARFADRPWQLWKRRVTGPDGKPK